MIRGLYTATSGMLVEQARQDVVTNNLSNVDTVGFKKDVALFRDEPNMDMHRIDDRRKFFEKKQDIDFRPYIGKLGTGASVEETATIHEQGRIEKTQNPTDVAIMGDGFFAIESPDGVRYTRGGNFRINADGYLTDADGNRVLALSDDFLNQDSNILTDEEGQLNIDYEYVLLEEAETLDIDSEGTVFINGEERNRLIMAEFDDQRFLRKIGKNQYVVDDPQAGTGRFPENTELIQGALEKSNVNIVREMVDMITVMRAYESNQKCITTQDQTLGTLITRVGS
ncbi:MAG: flagellar hook-basal body protein [Candidatus Muiribacteriota bacterium]